jgi:NADH-quinone oxidoreductase subunit A
MNDEMTEYLGILIFFALAGTVAGGFVILSSILGPKKPTRVKLEPFETGVPTFGVQTGRMSIKFYLTEMLFILFDVEVMFLYPWAVAFRELGLWGLGGMVIFFGILMVGFFYAWDNGALEWE